MTEPGELVLCPNSYRHDLLWPGVTVDLQVHAPDYVKKLNQGQGTVCVCFYGPSISQTRLRDFVSVAGEVIVPWNQHKLETVGNDVPKKHREDFKAAREEALSVEAGYLDPYQGMLPKVDVSTPCCFSCGKPMKAKEAAAAKEQGDHCYDCQALFEAGRHCDVCKRVWFEYEADRLAMCKRCGGHVHATCDAKAANAVHASAAAEAPTEVKQEELDMPGQGTGAHQRLQLVPAANNQAPHHQRRNDAAAHIAYNCPSCRQKLAAESQMDLLHLHAVLLADMRPTRPRAAAEIFAVDFARKHLASGGELDLPLLQGLISRAWLEEEGKAAYEQQTAAEEAAYKAALPQYEALFKQYVSLAASQRKEVDLSLALDPARLLGPGSAALGARAMLGAGSSIPAAALPPMRSSRLQQPQPLMLTGRQGSGAAAAGDDDGGAVAKRASVVGSGQIIKAEDGSDVPQEIPIICNGIKGTFLLAEMKVICSCTACAVQPVERRTFSATQYEQHAGCGSAKKWKASIRIEPGAVPECRKGSTPMAFGKWLDIKGIEAKGSRSSTRSHDHHAPPAAVEWAPQVLSGPAASVKRHSEMLQQQQQQQQQRAQDSGTGGPSPCSSSKGANDGAAVGGGGDAGGATSSGVGAAKPAGTTGIPRNRRPDSWAPWEDVSLGQYKPIEVRWAGDHCCVCDSDVDYDVDRLVSCDGCGITVHQSCYGIPELPDIDDMWLCRSCELKEPGAPEPQCCLCPMVGGGLKPTTIPGLWAHAACMQWIPEVTCIEPSRMEPIDRIQHIQKERWELLCCICRQRMGAKIQCNDCYQAYHPLCARRIGLHMEMADPAVPDGPLQLVTFCPKHCTPNPHGVGISLVSNDDNIRIGRPRKRLAGAISSSAAATPSAAAAADTEGDGGPNDNTNNGLWNAQPFRANRPPAPVPDAPGGCARAAPFSAKQIQHGTGTGCTSIEGWWIPTEDAAAAAAGPAGGAGSEAGGPCSSSTSALPGATAAAAALPSKPLSGRKRKRGRGSTAAAFASKGSCGSSAAKKHSKGPPPEVELLPLPDGVPDRVDVVCNGRHAVLLVRPQRVLLGDQELTASRFEAMCGKGDAKKWKSSLWATGPDGEPECSMGDWLSKHGLDKTQLSKLASNWSAIEQRRIWEEEQQQQEGQEEPEAGQGEGTANGGRQDSSIGDGAATTEDGDDMTDAVTDAVTEDGEQQDAAESEAMQVDGADSAGAKQQQQQQAADVKRQLDAGLPAAKKRRVSDKSDKDPTSAAAAGGDLTGCHLAQAASNASSAMASLPAEERVTVAAAAAAATSAQQQQRQEAPGESLPPAADGQAATDAPDTAGQRDVSPQTAEAAAAALRKQQGRVLLHKMLYSQLPDSFAVHPSVLPHESAVAAAAARRKAAATASAGQPDPVAALAAAAAVEVAAAAGSCETSVAGLSAEKDPWLVVGRCCRMYWQDDDAWYEADVTSYDPVTQRHSLWYHIDEVREEIDLADEERQQRVQWLPLVDSSKWPKPRRNDKVGQQQQPADEVWDTAGDGGGFVVGGPWGAAGVQQQQQQLLMQMLLGSGSGEGAAAAAGMGALLAGMQNPSGAAAAADGLNIAGLPPPPAREADEHAAAVQIPPPGFPRLTAMHRDASDGSSVDLLALSSSGMPVTEQLQRMVWQQQQQFTTFSRMQPPPGQAPSGLAAVGWRVGVFSQDVQMYYYGQLISYDAASGLHTVVYDDGLQDSIDLLQEKLDWVAADGGRVSHAARQVAAGYMQLCAAAERWQHKQQQQRAAAAGTAAGQGRQQQTFLQLQLQLQQLGWQPGMPVPPEFHQQVQQVLAMLQQQQQQQPPAAATSQHQPQQQPAPGPKPGPKPNAPTQIDVICGTNKGVFDCLKNAVITESGNRVSPTEFERMSGKGASKKWKCTIRVRKANGLPGITMGDWLMQMGYDQPKEPKGAGDGANRASLNDIRKQQASRRAAAAAGTGAAAAAARGGGSNTRPSEDGGRSMVPGKGVALHRDGCMCVICKQARRKAAQEAGVAPAPQDAYVPRTDGPGSSRAAGYSAPARSSSLGRDGFAGKQPAADDRRRVKLPSVLLGKRAYVQAVPHVVRGAAVHKQWQIPESKCYTPEQWEATQQGTSSAVGAAAGASRQAGSEQPAGSAVSSGSRPGTPSLDSRAAAPQPSEGAAAAAAEAGDGATSSGAGGKQQQQQQQQQPNGEQPVVQPQQHGDRADKRGSRTQTWREKLRMCRSLENKRITFGKSGIHGWGIFARQPIEQDSMVTEFRGQLVRCILADVREVKYRKQARDCYMFHATDETVIDNTGCGNYSRFTNHCCAPCLYAKPLELGGELHLCFFAKTNIKVGQELTFDYRFKEEDSDSKVICQCGAPTCKGTLN